VEGGSCDTMTRKRRRGIIEKRRRDRINNSLAELRRLVPSAFEKQGSAKLEKAEILQLTVEHLKTVHVKGKFFLFINPLCVINISNSKAAYCLIFLPKFLDFLPFYSSLLCNSREKVSGPSKH